MCAQNVIAWVARKGTPLSANCKKDPMLIKEPIKDPLDDPSLCSLNRSS
jgi:hypothetical protein